MKEVDLNVIKLSPSYLKYEAIQAITNQPKVFFKVFSRINLFIVLFW